jgi:hypothetical protein
MTKLTWTTEKPTEAGTYWLRSPGCKRRLFELRLGVCDGAVALMDEDGATLNFYEDCEFAGPIPAPEEP